MQVVHKEAKAVDKRMLTPMQINSLRNVMQHRSYLRTIVVRRQY